MIGLIEINTSVSRALFVQVLFCQVTRGCLPPKPTKWLLIGVRLVSHDSRLTVQHKMITHNIYLTGLTSRAQ